MDYKTKKCRKCKADIITEAPTRDLCTPCLRKYEEFVQRQGRGNLIDFEKNPNFMKDEFVRR